MMARKLVPVKKTAMKAVTKAVAKKSVAKKSTGVSATYRRLALALPYVVEDSHMRAADFRIELAGKRRIFATLAYESKGQGTLMLDAEQQAAFLEEAPEYFSVVPGGWGRTGATLVMLDAPESVLAGGLETAHRHTLGKMQAVRVKTKAKIQRLQSKLVNDDEYEFV
ncbi:hypothetical protein [Granulicella sp. 5B5]|uniref:hypothetical protein n=1 Tax=Granulicella sp. 5B5 TaxID=1617967 RepID=UPI0015F4AB8B|nr:hypothetical protein [Granulicella sp. 5B5]